MRTAIFAILSSVLFFSSAPANAGGFEQWKASCIANGATNIRQVGGQWKCDPPHGPAVTAVIESINPAYAAFKADCDAQGGTIYEAAAWNQMEPAKRLGLLQPGQLKCYRGASWTKD